MTQPQLIRCSNCGATNRVPPEKLQAGLEPVCGRCHQPLSTGAKPISVTDATFANEVERSTLPVLMDLWAPWCGPCKMLTPVLESLASELAGQMRVVKLNVDENPATAARFGIQSIPTLLVFKKGQEVDRMVGMQPKAEILRRVQRLIA
jgi:thioredoxin 2